MRYSALRNGSFFLAGGLALSGCEPGAHSFHPIPHSRDALPSPWSRINQLFKLDQVLRPIGASNLVEERLDLSKNQILLSVCVVEQLQIDRAVVNEGCAISQ